MNKKIKTSDLLLSIWIILSFFSFKTSLAQDTTYKAAKPVFIQASLLYDFPQSYGSTIGINYPLSSIIKSRVSKNGRLFIKQKDQFWGVNIGAYRYPYNYTGVLVSPFIGERHYIRRSCFFETSIGIGLLRTFYDGNVYEVDAAGNVKEKSLFGRFYATAHLSSAWNFLLQKQHKPVLVLLLKPTLWFQYPFNSFIKPHISVEAGIKYEIHTHTIKVRKAIKHLQK